MHPLAPSPSKLQTLRRCIQAETPTTARAVKSSRALANAMGWLDKPLSEIVNWKGKYANIIYIYTYMHVYIFIFIYVFIYLFVYIFIKTYHKIT